jgi:hypothetical protein
MYQPPSKAGQVVPYQIQGSEQNLPVTLPMNLVYTNSPKVPDAPKPKKYTEMVALQNTKFAKYLAVSRDRLNNALSDQIGVFDIRKSRDQDAVFIIQYERYPDLGTETPAVIVHHQTKKYVTPDGPGIKLDSGSRHVWGIIETVGGDILIQTFADHSRRFLSCTEVAAVLEDIDASRVNNTGKAGYEVEAQQWSRVISAHISDAKARELYGLVGLPLSTEI